VTHEEVLQALQDRFGPESFTTSQFRDNRRIIVPASHLFDMMQALKGAGFDQLVEIAGIDYLHYPDARDRFGVVYCLLNTVTGLRLFVKVFLNEPDLTIPSVFSLWKGADWLEREVFDMFGIVFEGHPDLRRILLPDEFTAFALRKDYPLRGQGERHNFPVLTRAEG
jgi:NADH-quinone oxidoreductase subunit C